MLANFGRQPPRHTDHRSLLWLDDDGSLVQAINELANVANIAWLCRRVPIPKQIRNAGIGHFTVRRHEPVVRQVTLVSAKVLSAGHLERQEPEKSGDHFWICPLERPAQDLIDSCLAKLLDAAQHRLKKQWRYLARVDIW